MTPARGKSPLPGRTAPRGTGSPGRGLSIKGRFKLGVGGWEREPAESRPQLPVTSNSTPAGTWLRKAALAQDQPHPQSSASFAHLLAGGLAPRGLWGSRAAGPGMLVPPPAPVEVPMEGAHGLRRPRSVLPDREAGAEPGSRRRDPASGSQEAPWALRSDVGAGARLLVAWASRGRPRARKGLPEAAHGPPVLPSRVPTPGRGCASMGLGRPPAPRGSRRRSSSPAAGSPSPALRSRGAPSVPADPWVGGAAADPEGGAVSRLRRNRRRSRNPSRGGWTAAVSWGRALPGRAQLGRRPGGGRAGVPGTPEPWVERPRSPGPPPRRPAVPGALGLLGRRQGVPGRAQPHRRPPRSLQAAAPSLCARSHLPATPSSRLLSSLPRRTRPFQLRAPQVPRAPRAP